jgi:prepilin-type N-terminal cleavage/methylation domain-containing protein
MLVNSKGYTLVEILIVMSIISVIVVLSSEIVINMTAVAVKTSNKISVEQDYSFMDLKFSRIFQDSSSIKLSGGNQVIANYEGTDYYFSFDSDKINFKKGADVTFEPLNNNPISEFSVSVGTSRPNSIKISFKISRDKDITKYKAESFYERTFILQKTR